MSDLGTPEGAGVRVNSTPLPPEQMDDFIRRMKGWEDIFRYPEDEQSEDTDESDEARP